jgi:hypothetical protein
MRGGVGVLVDAGVIVGTGMGVGGRDVGVTEAGPVATGVQVLVNIT